MNIDGKTITLDIAGLGILVHSPWATEHIPDGTDYLTSNYSTDDQVQPHIQRGGLVGFGTGSPGTFRLEFRAGAPDDDFHRRHRLKLRLGLECRGGIVCFRDLYELLDWQAECPADRTLPLPDGRYRITLGSNVPSSGFLGDDQRILFHFEPVSTLPPLAREGIPTLGP